MKTLIKFILNFILVFTIIFVGAATISTRSDSTTPLFPTELAAIESAISHRDKIGQSDPSDPSNTLFSYQIDNDTYHLVRSSFINPNGPGFTDHGYVLKVSPVKDHYTYQYMSPDFHMANVLYWVVPLRTSEVPMTAIFGKLNPELNQTVLIENEIIEVDEQGFFFHLLLEDFSDSPDVLIK